MFRSVVRGLGAYLPDKVLTNAEIAEFLDTSDEWIVERSGIRQRHIAAEGELTSDLALQCALLAPNVGLPLADHLLWVLLLLEITYPSFVL